MSVFFISYTQVSSESILTSYLTRALKNNAKGSIYDCYLSKEGVNDIAKNIKEKQFRADFVEEFEAVCSANREKIIQNFKDVRAQGEAWGIDWAKIVVLSSESQKPHKLNGVKFAEFTMRFSYNKKKYVLNSPRCILLPYRGWIVVDNISLVFGEIKN